MPGSIVSRCVKRPLKAATRPVVRRIDDARDRRHGVPVPPWSLRSQVPGDFRAVGRAFLDYMVDLGGLRPDDRLLDIGCRAGRMAIPLTGYLGAGGAYDAVDDWPEGTAWCQQVITARYPNFRFRQLSMGGPPPVAGAAEATRPAAADATAPAPEPLPYAGRDVRFRHARCHPPADARGVRLVPRRSGPGHPARRDLLRHVVLVERRTDPTGIGRRGAGRGAAPAIACTEDEARRRLGSLGLAVDAVHRGRLGRLRAVVEPPGSRHRPQGGRGSGPAAGRADDAERLGYAERARSVGSPSAAAS